MAEQDLSGVRSIALDAQTPDRLRAFIQDRAMMQIEAFHTRLDALLAQQQQRFWEVESGFEGMNSTVHDQVEAFYVRLDDMQADRLRYGSENELAELVDRVEKMQQTREQGQTQGHEHGMDM